VWNIALSQATFQMPMAAWKERSSSLSQILKAVQLSYLSLPTATTLESHQEPSPHLLRFIWEEILMVSTTTDSWDGERS
jgi:hypothetical protein